MIKDPEELLLARLSFPKGTRVQLINPQNGEDDPSAPPPGTKGIVREVDEYGFVRVTWETGSKYGLDLKKDRFCIYPLKIIYGGETKFWINIDEAIKYYTNIAKDLPDNSSKERKNELNDIILALKGNFEPFSVKKK